MAYIYRIINKVNGKFYIGSTKDISKRWYQHCFALNNNTHYNTHLQNAWNKYGEENFEFEILEECDDNKQFEIEQEYLYKYQPFGENGYNISTDIIDPFKRSPMIKKCETCGKDFETYYTIQKYCSDECQPHFNNDEEAYDSYPDWVFNKKFKNSRYEFKDVSQWDVEDFYAAWWDDMMEK